MQKKKVKAKKKVDKTNVAAIIVSVIALLGLTAVLAGCVLIVTMLKDKPQLSLDDFNNAESSIILDRNGEQISELGTVLRQNVEYALDNYTSKASSFGCCSMFIECSDAKRCIHENKLYSKACAYRKNLEAGRIFYGKNKTIPD